MRSGVEALVVNHVRRGPGQMLGMGDGGILNTLTGGEYDRVSAQLDRLETALKISIAASVVAGAVALASFLGGRR
jgi:hypothetical protein